jgi:RNA polymerase sigma factor (sigma-70 family)
MRGSDVHADAIEALYRERFRAFVVSATAILRDGDAALDVVQETFALALRRRSSFRGEGTLEAWVWKILLNVARDRGRARWRRSRPIPTPPEPESHAEPDDADVRTFLNALPERQRRAVFLRYYADLSYAEIADVLGVRPGTVAAALNSAHGVLREQIQELHPELQEVTQ